MSTKEKLIKRLLSKPNDFTYDELRTLLKYLGFSEDTGANVSRVRFYNSRINRIIKIHKPHPGNIVKMYVIKEIIDLLKEDKLI
ncbi:MAG: type II toxin-antitoxin system HicA family toxin [Clostridia bacterium]|nr:type II toxin-antitoxin system HicA family toxin [Clostridia bacterium]